MKKLARVLLGVLMATALVGAAAATTGTGTADAATSYVSSKYQAPKRGQSSKAVKALQQRLNKAKVLEKKNITSYFGPLTEKAVKKFQKKANLKQTGKVDKKTWSKLVAQTGKIKITTTKSTASSGKKPSKNIPKRCLTSGRVLCVDKTTDKLYYIKNKKVIKTMDARFGCASTRTREGSFRLFRKSRNHVSSIYHTPMPYAMFFSGGQAVHYSPDFAARGYAGCSHGCVNIRNKSGIRWVFDQVRVGDKVVVYKS